MPVIFYRCSICNEEYPSMLKAKQCEIRHENIEKQIKLIAESIDKLYQMGGKIELSIGSTTEKNLSCIGIRTDRNIMLLKDWTINDYKPTLFKA